MSSDVTPSSSPNVVRTTSFIADAAKFILAHARGAIAKRGVFRLALSGGNTPRAIHAELASIAGDLPWNKVLITFGDERCVPPDHPDSNYLMAKESLIDPVGIPEGNVFRIRGEIDPETAARECENKLAGVAARFGETRYVHDLILLGLGEDGHTASLFPGSAALQEVGRNVIPAIGPKPPPQRVTFTFPLLNAAREVCFLAKNDPAKKHVIDAVIAGDRSYPAAHVKPESGSVTWIIGE